MMKHNNAIQYHQLFDNLLLRKTMQKQQRILLFSLTVMFLCFVPLVNTATSAQRMRYAVISSLRHCLTRIKGKIKASLRVLNEAVGCLDRNTKRGKRICTFPLQVVAYLETSYIPFNDCFAAMQIVMVTKRLLRPMSVLLSY